MITIAPRPEAPPAVRDRHGRPLRSLRVSLTDRCNLRCRYCMPEEEYVWLPREEILSFEELATLVGAFVDAGVDRLRLTGGEPLLRRDVDVLIGLLAAQAGLHDLALTTNGVLLARHAWALRAAGLRRVTVSLDTLRRARFLELTRRDHHADVLEGIAAARDAGFENLKINAVVMRGFNDDEIGDLVEFGRREGAEVRFIEYMDVGGATRWSMGQVVTREEILRAVASRHGEVRALGERGSAPADRFALPDGTTFGVIASTTHPFCGTCDRARLTTDGVLLTCLYAERGIDLRGPLRAGASRDELAARIRSLWSRRADRGAEERLTLARREVLVPVPELRRDPHREMHTRGG